MAGNDKMGANHRSRLFLCAEKVVSFPHTNWKHELVRLCYEDYWKAATPATGTRPSFEDLFPFSQLADEVKNSFLSPSMIRQFTELIGKLETAVRRLYDLSRVGTAVDGMENAMGDTLMAYYRLFWTVLREIDPLMNGLNLQKNPHSGEGQGYVFLRTLLNLGCSFRKVDDHIAGIVTPFAPRYLSAIYEMADLLAELYNEEPEELRWAEAEILNTFVSRFLRWFLISPDGVLCHAAVRPITSFPQEREDICILIRPIADYSSFEGISELRLFEKVKYELMWRAEKGRVEEPLRILIAGDIDADQIVRFGRMLESWLKSWLKSRLKDRPGTPKMPDISFTMFTDNYSFAGPSPTPWEKTARQLQWPRMEYQPMCRLFESPKSLKQQVDGADLLFFLDCRQLYEDFYGLNCSDLSAFFQQTADMDLSVVHRSASGHVLSPSNPFFQVQNLLLGRIYTKDETALLKKRVSTIWLDRIAPLLASGDKMAYFYYSDLDAAQDLYWREDCFVRAEDYAGKRMVILRYGRRDGAELEMAEGKENRVIVFDLWQFIKHCNLHRVDYLVEHFGLKDTQETDCAQKIHLLSEVLIGVDYSDWPKTLNLTYSYLESEPCFQQGDFSKRLQAYMEDIIFPCFLREKTGIYYAYLRKCIASFLFGDARTLDDVLFVHIFKRHFALLQEVTLKREEDHDKLTPIRPKKTSYSGKRFYQEVMGDYDEPYWYVQDQRRKLELMERSGQLQPYKVFRNILEVCERNQYAGSDLHSNCTRWLEENPGNS